MAAVDSFSFSHQPPHGSLSGLNLTLNLPIMEDSPPRPASALARGVHITEYKGNQVNPEPLPFEESEILLEDYLSPRKLRDLTGMDNLEDVNFLEMKVDTRDTSLGNFGSHLPNLKHLKLSNSIILTIRDLGSSLHTLRVLWMARCGLEDIDGVSAMCNLQELYLAYNEIYDISACSMLDHLKILDLEGNNLDEISQAQYLALCSRLTNLTLEGNPLCVTPSPDTADPTYDYRAAVHKVIPQLQMLDDEPLVDSSASSKSKASASVFDDDWKLINELLEEGAIGDGSDENLENAGRPVTGLLPQTGYRPGSALKQQLESLPMRPGSTSKYSMRPGTGSRLGTGGRPGTGARVGTAGRPGSGSRPGTGARPGTGSVRPGSSEDFDVDDASALTTGGVVCGNPSKALRTRNKNPDMKKVPHLLAKYKAEKAEQSNREETQQPKAEEEAVMDEDLKELFSELQSWKSDHRKRQAEIDATKAPQVLRIDHDDAVSLSDDDESIDSDDDEDEASRQALDRHGNGDSHVPHPPSAKSGARPKSGLKQDRMQPAAEYRAERGMTSAQLRQQYRMRTDESFDAQADILQSPEIINGRLGSPSGHPSSPGELIPTPPSPLSRSGDDSRPFSGPHRLGTKGKFKLEPVVDKTRTKSIDKLNPIVRSSVHSPEQRVPDGPRGVTAQPALGQTPIARIRRSQLANVQLLPSKLLQKK